PVRRRVLREPPLRAGLPHGGGARAAGRRPADVPAGNVDPRPALRPALRRRGGPPRRPTAVGVGGEGEPLPDPAGRGAAVVALPPPVRRSPAREPAGPVPGPGAGAASRGIGLVRGARPPRRGHPPRTGRRRHTPGG